MLLHTLHNAINIKNMNSRLFGVFIFWKFLLNYGIQDDNIDAIKRIKENTTLHKF